MASQDTPAIRSVAHPKVCRLAVMVCLWPILGLVAMGLILPVPAQAFELFGVRLFGAQESADDETPIGDPLAYTITFTLSGSDQTFDTDTLRAASALWGGRDEPADGAAGLLADARSDYRRILGALYGLGHYGGTLSIRVAGQEAADLSPDTPLAAPVTVVVEVDPGPLYRFGQALLVNPAPPTDDPADQVESPADQGFAQGAPARSGVILAAERLALQAWRQQGHALASISERHVEAIHPQNRLDVRITIDPGRPAVYGPLDVQGTERMDPSFVAYMADLPPGQAYDPDDVEEASARLAALDVFRSIRIEDAGLISADGSLPATLFVQERPLRRIGFGGNLSSVDGLGLEAYWLHRNLFGRAERLRLDGRVSGITSVDPEDFTYRLDAAFTRPGIITPDTRLLAALSAEREVLEQYTQTGVSGRLGLEHVFSPQLSARLAVTGRYAHFEDLLGDRDFLGAGFEAGIVYDTRDLAADARSGFYLAGEVSPFFDVTRDTAGISVAAEGRAYASFGRSDAVTLAARLRIGTLMGPSVSQTAPDRLFFAGGGGSVRGYAYRNIGVVQPGGTVTGGRFLTEGSLELRARFTDSLGGVLFTDAGFVGQDSLGTSANDLRIGVGAGLRYLTPIGPLRLDVAVPLDRGAGDPDFAVYIGIGQAF